MTTLLAPIINLVLRYVPIVDLLEFTSRIGRVEFILEHKGKVTLHYFYLFFCKFGSPRDFKVALEPVTKFRCFHNC